MMEKVLLADDHLKAARNSFDRDYEAAATELNRKQSDLAERMEKLNETRLRIAHEHGNVNASENDLVEINAGGKIIAAKRSTLTQQIGTRMEALFSGRWDKTLQRDSNGRIFLDVNPACFQAIVDYFNEMAISSEDDPPHPPVVCDEDTRILRSQLELLGLYAAKMPDSDIIGDIEEVKLLHDWMEVDGSDVELDLLYRSSRDGLSGANFHSKCDDRGCTLTVVETTDGFVLGGYSNAPWTSGNSGWKVADKAFLFVLSGNDVTHPRKMKLRDADHAVFDHSGYGPTFGEGYDLFVDESNCLNSFFGNSYESGPPGRLTTRTHGYYTRYAIREMEVFEVRHISPSLMVPAVAVPSQHRIPKFEPAERFSQDINEAIDAKRESLLLAEAEMLQLEESLEDERNFISIFAGGDAKDVVTLNVSGTIMTTKRSTLCVAENSVLAQQFHDTKWTEQGCNASRIEEWTPDDVCDWARNISSLREDVGALLKESDITGCELLAMNMEGLKMIGVGRAGTLCLLLKEIEKLEKASRDVVTLVEHSPYCFG
ncbi:hypothetical protein ACHAWF_007171, partial [Thalassiosira exigua]